MKKYTDDTKKIEIKKESVLYILFIGIVTFFIVMKSGYDIFSKGGSNPTDSDVFRCIGWLMYKGKVPYRDVFDHKGPLLYIINYLSTYIAEIRGVWVVECVCWLITVSAIFCIARKYCNGFFSCVATLFVLSRCSICMAGNCCEEYAACFMVVSLYYFLDYFENEEKYIYDTKKLFDLRIIIVGFSFGSVFFIKSNLCSLWIIFGISIFIGRCCKEINVFVRFIVSFLIGFVAIAGPMILYLYRNNALSYFVDDYFTFNKIYATNAQRASLFSRVNSFSVFFETTPFILSLIIILYSMYEKGVNKLRITYLIYIIVNLGLLTFTGQHYPKMELAIIPSFIYPSCLLFGYLSDKKIDKRIMIMALSLLLITEIVPNWSEMVKSASKDIAKYSNGDKGMLNDDVVKYIKKNTTENDTISVFGNECRLYFYTSRLPASRHIFMPDPRVDERIPEEYFDDLRQNKPRIIVVQRNFRENYKDDSIKIDDDMKDFLADFEYRLVIDGDKRKVYQLD